MQPPWDTVAALPALSGDTSAPTLPHQGPDVLPSPACLSFQERRPDLPPAEEARQLPGLGSSLLHHGPCAWDGVSGWGWECNTPSGLPSGSLNPLLGHPDGSAADATPVLVLHSELPFLCNCPVRTSLLLPGLLNSQDTLCQPLSPAGGVPLASSFTRLFPALPQGGISPPKQSLCVIWGGLDQTPWCSP